MRGRRAQRTGTGGLEIHVPGHNGTGSQTRSTDVQVQEELKASTAIESRVAQGARASIRPFQTRAMTVVHVVSSFHALPEMLTLGIMFGVSVPRWTSDGTRGVST